VSNKSFAICMAIGALIIVLLFWVTDWGQHPLFGTLGGEETASTPAIAAQPEPADSPRPDGGSQTTEPEWVLGQEIVVHGRRSDAKTQ